jgi:hypothetical protein
MKLSTISAVVVAVAMTVVGTGCGAQAVQPVQTAQTAQVSQASGNHWQTRKLADGVEIRVSDDAGPEATQLVEELQKEMRSRYINAQ